MKKKRSHSSWSITRSEYIAGTVKNCLIRGLKYPPAFLVSVFMHRSGKVEEAVLKVLKELVKEAGAIGITVDVHSLSNKILQEGHYKGKKANRWIIAYAHFLSVLRAVKSLERKGIVYSRMVEKKGVVKLPVIDRQGNYVKTKPRMEKRIHFAKEQKFLDEIKEYIRKGIIEERDIL